MQVRNKTSALQPTGHGHPGNHGNSGSRTVSRDVGNANRNVRSMKTSRRHATAG